MNNIFEFVANCLANHPQELREKLMRAVPKLLFIDEPKRWAEIKAQAAEVGSSVDIDMVFDADGKITTYNPIENSFTESGGISAVGAENEVQDTLGASGGISEQIHLIMQGYSACEQNMVLAICCLFNEDGFSEKQKSVLEETIKGCSDKINTYRAYNEMRSQVFVPKEDVNNEI